MPADNREWFIRERSEALASLFLTSRKDVHVRSEEGRDNGADLFVELQEGNSPAPKVFVVQVRGTLSSDKAQWMQSAEQLFKAGPSYLPVCVFMINVRDNNAEYAWLAEPQVDEKNSARLTFFDHGDFHKLDSNAVDQIINRVKQWYDVIPRNSMTVPST